MAAAKLLLLCACVTVAVSAEEGAAAGAETEAAVERALAALRASLDDMLQAPRALWARHAAALRDRVATLSAALQHQVAETEDMLQHMQRRVIETAKQFRGEHPELEAELTTARRLLQEALAAMQGNAVAVAAADVVARAQADLATLWPNKTAPAN